MSKSHVTFSFEYQNADNNTLVKRKSSEQVEKPKHLLWKISIQAHVMQIAIILVANMIMKVTTSILLISMDVIQFDSNFPINCFASVSLNFRSKNITVFNDTKTHDTIHKIMLLKFLFLWIILCNVYKYESVTQNLENCYFLKKHFKVLVCSRTKLFAIFGKLSYGKRLYEK